MSRGSGSFLFLSGGRALRSRMRKSHLCFALRNQCHCMRRLQQSSLHVFRLCAIRCNTRLFAHFLASGHCRPKDLQPHPRLGLRRYKGQSYGSSAGSSAQGQNYCRQALPMDPWAPVSLALTKLVIRTSPLVAICRRGSRAGVRSARSVRLTEAGEARPDAPRDAAVAQRRPWRMRLLHACPPYVRPTSSEYRTHMWPS